MRSTLYRTSLVGTLCVLFGFAASSLFAASPSLGSSRFYGKVIFADQTPVVGATVSLICQDTVRKQVKTSVGGEFTLNLRGSTDSSRWERPLAMARALRSDEVDPLRWQDCRIVASLSGFSSVRQTLHPTFMVPVRDLGTFVIAPKERYYPETVSVAALKIPVTVQQRLRLMRERLSMLPEESVNLEDNLRTLIGEYPSCAEAWQLLGEVRVLRQKTTEAVEAFSRAMKIDPHFIPAYLARAELLLNQNRGAEALEFLDTAYRLDPDLIKTSYLLAFAHLQSGDSANARKAAERAATESDQESYTGAHYLLGILYRQDGLAEKALQEFRLFLAKNPDGSAADQAREEIRLLGSPETSH